MSMKPIVNGLEQKYGEQIEFRRVDIDDEQSDKISRKYRVSGVPTYVFLDGNEELIFSRSGGRTEARMASDLELLLQP
jgi:thiol-disulfide isomerase/thioredoxin